MAPGYLPFIGHTVALFKAVGNYPCTWDLFARWATATAPKPVRVQIFTRHCVVIADPSTMKRVMSSNMKNYSKDTEFSYAPFLEILGTGLVTSGGESWRRMRGHISKALRVEILDEIIAIANRAVERLCVKLDDAARGASVDMENEFRRLTLQVIGEAILSLQPEQSDELFPSLYLPIMDECNARSLSPWRAWTPTPEWFAPSRAKGWTPPSSASCARAGRARLGRAAGAPAPDDILERVLEQVDVREYGAETETQLCYEIKTFLLAGHETSAAMLTWTLHELSVGEKGMMRTVRAEAEAVFGRLKPGVLPTRDALASLEYTLAALKETLRLYSVVPVVTRVAEEDDDLGGVRVPAGTTVIMSLQGVHHRADVWPDPLTYKPDRFTQKDFDENEGFKFLPFIQGPRNCLGQYLAMLEARVVLGALVARYEFEPVNAARTARNTPRRSPSRRRTGRTSS